MFEDLEELMDREITKDDLYKGLYFSTAMSGFYVEMIYDAGPMVTVYETALPQQLVISTVAASLLMGGIYLVVAYIDFKKRDRD